VIEFDIFTGMRNIKVSAPDDNLLL